jgi:hypothetical protein
MIASGTTFFGTVAIGVFGAGSGGLARLALLSGLSWLGTTILQVLRPGRRITKDLGAELRLKFWNSRLAKWFEKIARIGLKRSTTPAELTYRPTEMAIGLAADALFESLPKDQRKELKELPAVMTRLQKDAALMRKTVDDLAGALAGLGEQSDAARSSALAGGGGAAGAQLTDTRAKLRTDLTHQRDQAGHRLADAVAALENIRLSLLRLKAGTGTVDELTADLSAARALDRALMDAADARAEVDALLRADRPAVTPLPGPQHA